MGKDIVYKTPIGFRPVILRIISVFLLLIGVIMSLLFTIGAILDKRSIFEILANTFIFLMLPGYPGLRLASRYPEIRMSSKGVNFRYLRFITGVILWKEIDTVIKLDRPKSFKDYYAVVIDREGVIYPFVTKGLFIQSMYAPLFRTNAPVLLISPGLLDKDEINKIKEAANS
jgi:hypothetical protein